MCEALLPPFLNGHVHNNFIFLVLLSVSLREGQIGRATISRMNDIAVIVDNK